MRCMNTLEEGPAPVEGTLVSLQTWPTWFNPVGGLDGYWERHWNPGTRQEPLGALEAIGQ